MLPPRLTIIFEPGEDGFWVASIPEVPGALSQGRTQAEARENVIDALGELMTARRESALEDLAQGSSVEELTFDKAS